ncbi:MAG: galactokinase [Oscillospiraceae bacterium]|nr:galactokinase [Oscillospiraceae bacterium]
MNSRIQSLKEKFRSVFPDAAPTVFSASGRTELGGNHTDHQHGRVLCAAVSLDTVACAAANGSDIIRIHSEGYEPFEVPAKFSQPSVDEFGTSAALVRGVVSRIIELGYTVGGFDACIESDVLPGSGLSSSAAFEVLIGTVINHFFCEGKLSPADIARIGQYAENVYFGKPCGLMDQMASAVGGAVAIDFADPNDPVVRRIDFDFSVSGHALCIIDTHSEHGDLTEDYAAITHEMGAIAKCFGTEHLRQVDEDKFRSAIPEIRAFCGDRAVLRAMHFFAENNRAAAEAEALERGDFPAFLNLVNESGFSSALLLENIWSPADPQRQAVTLALAIGRELLCGRGAIRVHGGGFAGTVQAFVPNDILESFTQGMERIFGSGCCHVLSIRNFGGCVIE